MPATWSNFIKNLLLNAMFLLEYTVSSFKEDLALTGLTLLHCNTKLMAMTNTALEQTHRAPSMVL